MSEVTRLAAAVRSGQTSAMAVLDACLGRIEAQAAPLVAITHMTVERARAEAALVDAKVAAGIDPGPLAGVPYGVKDLFDVAGLPTTAGSRIHADAPPATQDALAIARLRDAGAVLVATLNMDEFAYGFATINARHGTTRNPHDLTRLAGGSSGGSASVVAAGLLPFSLGSDTNGSIRVPAGLTGIFGLKPTHADLPLDGVFPFAHSFDDIGPFTTSVEDMALVWRVLRGDGASGPDAPLRVARLGGRFAQNADPAQLAAIDAIAPDAPMLEWPDIAAARSAAFVITAAEGGRLHRADLAYRALDFDPATRDRLIAGALLPDALVDEAQAFRAAWRLRIAALMADHDVLLAPGAPCVAPPVANPMIEIDGRIVPARADLGIHTQPVTFAGLPSLAVPLNRPGALPLGLQIIGRAGGEQALFAFAADLVKRGLVGVSWPGAHMIDAGKGA